jgi:capsule polysaccharide export protein KpsE/RkpR
METYFRTKSLFQLIFKWKWHLLVLIVIAGTAGIFVSSPMIMQPKFKSSAILYPANIFPFSEESETEQMLEILQSFDIRNQIFKSFNLAEHYEIDTSQAYYYTTLNKKFESNVSFQKTPNEAVQIVVMDSDPLIACQIVDSIISFYSLKLREMQREKSKEVVIIQQNQIAKRQYEIDSLTDVIDNYRNTYGLLDYKSQVKVYSEAIQNGKNLQEARNILENWQELGSDYRKTDSLLWYAMTDFHVTKKALEEAKMHVEKNLTYAHVITHPYPADKKSWPVRWLIVLFSVVGAFFGGVVVIALIESAKTKN